MMTKAELAAVRAAARGTGWSAECCRCGRPVIAEHYWLTDNASPAHWDCLTLEEQEAERQ